MPDSDHHGHSVLNSVLNLLKIDQYYLREANSSSRLSAIKKNYLILLANKNNLPPGDLLFLLKNILKYLKISEESCVFLWPSQKMGQEITQEVREVFLKMRPEFILNFGVDFDVNFVLPVAMQTLDLSSVLLDPKLKRKVFEDVSRLLLSPSGA